MITHKGIAWPTNIAQDLVTRVRESATTLSMPVAVATEIYELGTEFRIGQLNVMGKNQYFVTNLLDVAEAVGYARVGHEILYFNRPIGPYVPIREFWAVDTEEPEMSLASGTLIDATELVKGKTQDAAMVAIAKLNTEFLLGLELTGQGGEIVENQMTAEEVDERLRNEQIIQRKLGLLRRGGYRAVLKDLQREAEEEQNRRNISSSYPEYKDIWELLNLMGHAVRGIKAGIQRYEQLYQICASP